MNRYAAGHRRLAAALGLSLVMVGLAVAGPALPAHAAACVGLSSGVTVVVDFSAFGGGVQVGCASGDPATGLAALRGAGFAVTGTQRWGTAFVCRIDDHPGVDVESCVNTPPGDAYWAYWHAPRGGVWSYSNLGAASYNPAPGSVQGWAFGNAARPGIAPPAAPRPLPPAATTSGPKTPAAPPAGGNPVSGGAGASTTAIPTAPPVTASPVRASGLPSPGLSTMDTSTGLAEPPPGGSTGGGSTGGGLAGVAAGAALVLAVSGVAVWTVRRRRTAAGAAPQ